MYKMTTKKKDLENKLAKLEFDLNNRNNFIYEECNELKRLVQLNGEEIIADLKITNNFSIDSDLNELDSETRGKIEEINNSIEYSINQIEKFEQKIISKQIKPNENLSKQIQCLRKIKNLKKLELRLVKLIDLVKQFLFDNNLMEFRPSDHEFKLGYIYLNQIINFNKLARSKSKVSVLNNNFEILDSKKLIISYKNNTAVSSYNLLNDNIEKRFILNDFKIVNLKQVINTKIVLECCQNSISAYSKFVFILNHNFEITLKKVVGNISLISVNESFIYFKEKNKIKTFDWLLNEINEQIFQFEDISQFEIRNKMTILRTKEHVHICNEKMDFVKIIQTDCDFLIDSYNHLIVIDRSEKNFKYFDLMKDGEPCKQLNLVGLNDFNNLKAKIDSNNKLYLYFDQNKSYFYF